MKNFLLIVTLFTISFSATAQNTTSDKPFTLGISRDIYSNVLSEKRTLNIYLPQGYHQGDTTRYPVVFLLDGSADEDFVHICGIVQFLNMIGFMPKTIIVGIANIDRKRDFTYPTTIEKDKKAYPTTGGSAHFITFLEKELLPYIDSSFNTNHTRTIVGQSLGGLVATEILLKKPALFNNYLIVSPSLWWSNEALLHQAPQLLQQLPNTPMQVFISVGAEGAQMENDAKELVSDLQKLHKPGLQVFFHPLLKDNHLTILHHAAYDGFEQLFKPQQQKASIK